MIVLQTLVREGFWWQLTVGVIDGTYYGNRGNEAISSLRWNITDQKSFLKVGEREVQGTITAHLMHGAEWGSRSAKTGGFGCRTRWRLIFCACREPGIVLDGHTYSSLEAKRITTPLSEGRIQAQKLCKNPLFGSAISQLSSGDAKL